MAGEITQRPAGITAERHLGARPARDADYYFGGSYMQGQSIKPPSVLPEPLSLPGGVRVLVHGDPTFMVMETLKRQFEQIVGTDILPFDDVSEARNAVLEVSK